MKGLKAKTEVSEFVYNNNGEIPKDFGEEKDLSNVSDIKEAF